MISISNLNYPILDYTGIPEFFSQRSFRDIWREMTPEEFREAIANHGDDFLEGYVGKKGRPMITRYEVDAKRRASWPMLALDENSFESVGPEGLYNFDRIFAQLWPMFWADAIPEFVTTDIWDYSFYDKGEGYDDWLKELAEPVSGIALLPNRSALLYGIVPLKDYGDGFVDFIVSLDGKRLAFFYIGSYGWVSPGAAIDEVMPGLEAFVRSRGVPKHILFLQEMAYNILRLEYYKQRYMLKPRILTRGEIIETKDGPVKMLSENKIAVYGKNNNLS